MNCKLPFVVPCLGQVVWEDQGRSGNAGWKEGSVRGLCKKGSIFISLWFFPPFFFFLFVFPIKNVQTYKHRGIIIIKGAEDFRCGSRRGSCVLRATLTGCESDHFLISLGRSPLKEEWWDEICILRRDGVGTMGSKGVLSSPSSCSFHYQSWHDKSCPWLELRWRNVTIPEIRWSEKCD